MLQHLKSSLDQIQGAGGKDGQLLTWHNNNSDGVELCVQEQASLSHVLTTTGQGEAGFSWWDGDEERPLPPIPDLVWREGEPGGCLCRMHHTLWLAVLVLCIWFCAGDQCVLVQSFRSGWGKDRLLGLPGLRFLGRKCRKQGSRDPAAVEETRFLLSWTWVSVEEAQMLFCSETTKSHFSFPLLKHLIGVFLHEYNMFWSSPLVLILSPTSPPPPTPHPSSPPLFPLHLVCSLFLTCRFCSVLCRSMYMGVGSSTGTQVGSQGLNPRRKPTPLPAASSYYWFSDRGGISWLCPQWGFVWLDLFQSCCYTAAEKTVLLCLV